jgi:hypothetical protein
VTLTRFRYYPPKEDDKRLDSLAKLRMRRIDRDGTGELVTAIRPAFCEEHVKRGQRSKLYVLELHELRLSQRQASKSVCASSTDVTFSRKTGPF